MLTTSARPELFGRDERHYEDLPPQQFRFTGTPSFRCTSPMRSGAGCVDNSTIVEDLGTYDPRARPWYKRGKERKR